MDEAMLSIENKGKTDGKLPDRGGKEVPKVSY